MLLCTVNWTESNVPIIRPFQMFPRTSSYIDNGIYWAIFGSPSIMWTCRSDLSRSYLSRKWIRPSGGLLSCGLDPGCLSLGKNSVMSFLWYKSSCRVPKRGESGAGELFELSDGVGDFGGISNGDRHLEARLQENRHKHSFCLLFFLLFLSRRDTKKCKTQ